MQTPSATRRPPAYYLGSQTDLGSADRNEVWYRWGGAARPGYWACSVLHMSSLLVASCVVDDFGTLVQVPHGRRQVAQ
jgi:hypothetical protein